METPPPKIIDRLLQDAYPSFALLAGMQLNVFTPLAKGSLTTEQIAAAISVPAPKLAPLLYALVAIGLITVENNQFANTAEAQHYLVNTSPNYIGSLHYLLSDLWNATLKTADSIRLGQPQAEHNFLNMPLDHLYTFFLGLHDEALATGRDMARQFDFTSCRHLLDVGGGSGGLAIAITEACPGLNATVVDLPEVTPITARFIQEAGATDRVDTLASDVTYEPLLDIFDVAVLKAFIQTLPPDQARQALSNIGAALEPGSTIYILGNGLLDDNRASPPDAAIYNIVFLNIYRDGQAYTESEHRTWLAAADFENIQRHTQPDGTTFLTARKT